MTLGNCLSTMHALKRGSRQVRFLSSLKTGSLATAGENVLHKDYRLGQFSQLQLTSEQLYPRFNTVYPKAITQVRDLIRQHGTVIQQGERNTTTSYRICGRVMSKRASSSKLLFLDVQQDGKSIQIVLSQKAMLENGVSIDDFKLMTKHVHRGDVITVTGIIGKTDAGELSIFAQKDLRLLSPCLHDLPSWNGLRDPEKRFRNRHIDLITNKAPLQIIKTRARVIKYVRDFFNDRDFIEVETPLLSTSGGGANARPFLTHANTLDMDLTLRIAPELYLKTLIVGGMERIFEIGKCFRNEGIDATHNPEFTSCEFYQTYADLSTLIETTEELLSGLVKDFTGGTELHLSTTHRSYVDEELTSTHAISFARPFRQINLIDELERILDRDLPSLDSSDAIEQLASICASKNIPLPATLTPAVILDKMVSYLIEPNCLDPTFLVGHPLALSPLSKAFTIKTARSGRQVQVAARFELFINGRECANAYEELNDPAEQRARFVQQENDRKLGDLESHPVDEAYCQVLEYGLPPTGGWGMGLDRICMLMTDSHHIREVLAFPVMKPREPEKAPSLT